MANNFTEIMNVVNAGNKMGLSNTITRDYGIPLDLTSVHRTYLDALKYAATDATAYQGQVIAAAGKVYIIGESNGSYTYVDPQTNKEETVPVYIRELAQSSTTANIDARLQEIEKFFEVGDQESLEKTLDTLIEIQKYIEEHGEDFSGLLSDVGENREDINHIYSRWELNEDGSYKRDANGDRIPKTPTGELQDEIDRAIAAENIIYDADGKTVDGQPVATGLLPDEIARAIAAETKLAEDLAKEVLRATTAENFIYDADGGENEDGSTYATGLLPKEIQDRIDADQSINDHIASLFKAETKEGTVEYTGEIVDYIANAIPIATLTRLGRVKSAEKENFVKVDITTGEMEVYSLNIMKLTQTAGDLLVLDGGNASGITT